MIETSESTAKLDAALAKAQGEFLAAIKDSPNPAFKSKYADLTSVMEAIRPALTKHGISLTQWPVHSTDNRVHMVTRIAHDGEWIRGHFSMPCTKQDAHGYGSIVSYLRRYCVSACLGVITDLDDDGNQAVNRGAPPEEPKPITAAQFRSLRTLLEETGVNEEKLLSFVGATDFETMTQVQFRTAEDALKKKKNMSKTEAA